MQTAGRTLFLLFDGKSVEETSKRVKQAKQRLAVVIDSPNLEEPQVLGVPVTKTSRAEDQVDAIWPLLEEWGVLDQLAGASFDTTSENTGWQRGVVSRLQHAAAGQRTAVESLPQAQLWNAHEKGSCGGDGEH